MSDVLFAMCGAERTTQQLGRAWHDARVETLAGAEDDMEVEEGEAPPPPPPASSAAPPPPPPPPPPNGGPEAGPARPPAGYSAADALAAYGGDGVGYEAFAQQSIAYQARSCSDARVPGHGLGVSGT